MASGSPLRLSAPVLNLPGAGEDQDYGGKGSPDRARLGSLGVRDHLSSLRRSVDSSSAQGPPETGRGRDLPRAATGPRPSGLACVGERLMASGLTAEVVDTLQSARASSTRRQYDSKWRQFECWCLRQDPQVDPDHAPPKTVLSFLQSILEQGRCYSTLKGLVAAISACREGLGLAPVGQHRLVKDFLFYCKASGTQVGPCCGFGHSLWSSF